MNCQMDAHVHSASGKGSVRASSAEGIASSGANDDGNVGAVTTVTFEAQGREMLLNSTKSGAVRKFALPGSQD